MKYTLSRRNIVRIITFVTALILTLTGFAIMNYNDATTARMKLNYVYLRSIEDLSTSTDNIKTTLAKSIYCGTPEQLATVSSKLWKDSSTAKQALSTLPLSGIQIDNINRFLSQVGNYAVSVSKKSTEGEVLTLEDYVNLAALHDYSEKLSKEMWGLENKSQNGMISIANTRNKLADKNTPQPPEITEGFKSFEEGTDSYPTLIYDGPFSDHILKKESVMLKGLKEVDLLTAQKTAAAYAKVTPDKLQNKNDEGGKMPSYCFEGDNVYVSVTKAGGIVSTMLKKRDVKDMKISVNDALSTANAYLQNNGFKNVVTTYYETLDNICTINFAVLDNNVTVYTDLIKVSVAMDNGEILSMDARGYIVNHQERKMPEKIVAQQEAQKSLSPLLTVEKCKLAIIPSEGENEVLTYEFSCTSRQGQKVLVYVNAQTKIEEQILILFIQGNSVLTM